MNSIGSKFVGVLIMFAAVVAVGVLIVRPLIARQNEQKIKEARQAYEKEASQQERQRRLHDETSAKLELMKKEKKQRDEEIAAIRAELGSLDEEIAGMQKRRGEVIATMNDEAVKNRAAYAGRKFERFDPGNGRIYENVEVIGVIGRGLKLRSESGLLSIASGEVGENFKIRFRFGEVEGD